MDATKILLTSTRGTISPFFVATLVVIRVCLVPNRGIMPIQLNEYLGNLVKMLQNSINIKVSVSSLLSTIYVYVVLTIVIFI